ncbi:unnamed protein product [Didymodactylos carnosus]|uniref:Uncharacterized protein n=1 Tax=Didymodactylos carnosus TaxID=1234261 RepID=A0A8S2FDC0_9BILA|nr:unnamed protein product [Didymodactylos carnosus]CAF4230884.1 unnamed protein product [Didymodactylos carnosus]
MFLNVIMMPLLYVVVSGDGTQFTTYDNLTSEAKDNNMVIASSDEYSNINKTALNDFTTRKRYLISGNVMALLIDGYFNGNLTQANNRNK